MKIKAILFLAFMLVVGLYSCNNDDDGDDITTVPIRDRAEQQAEDKILIEEYLKSHYYNATYFESASSPTIDSLVIIAAEDVDAMPDGYSVIFDSTTVKTVPFADINYEIWYLNLNKGEGKESPTFADNVFVAYEGSFLDGEIFDASITPITFDLTNVIPGWRKIIPEFNTALSFSENEDGTVGYMNHGVGMMFVPSGLAYYANPPSSIPSYSCLNFKFNLYDMEENDHDNDLVPSYAEDYKTEDGEFTLNSSADVHDGDDTDGNDIPDYFDPDDDGDGILTKYEDTNKDGDPTNDIGKNGIPKYLDPEETESIEE